MGKYKAQKINCEVTTCLYNVGGHGCRKDTILVASNDKEDKTHYCKSYEHGCGFTLDN